MEKIINNKFFLFILFIVIIVIFFIINKYYLKKKIAIILFGISYLNKYEHWNNNDNYIIDYRKSLENYREYILDYFKNLGYDIDIYICTNLLDDNMKNNILNDYKPKSYKFIKNYNNIYASSNIKLKESIKLCLDSNIKYDNCLITRFDLLFKEKLTNINYNKINIISELSKEEGYTICDNFYFIPFKYLKQFNDIIKIDYDNINIKRNINDKDHYEYINKFHRHYIKDKIKKISDIHYIKNEKTYLDSLSFYKINRTKYK
tara:strand:- start:1333 stop:2115 length:783 start_codon:yes stop_codon:yes gene_type:complete